MCCKNDGLGGGGVVLNGDVVPARERVRGDGSKSLSTLATSLTGGTRSPFKNEKDEDGRTVMRAVTVGGNGKPSCI
jgi:hypothetical protein